MITLQACTSPWEEESSADIDKKGNTSMKTDWVLN